MSPLVSAFIIYIDWLHCLIDTHRLSLMTLSAGLESCTAVSVSCVTVSFHDSAQSGQVHVCALCSALLRRVLLQLSLSEGPQLTLVQIMDLSQSGSGSALTEATYM